MAKAQTAATLQAMIDKLRGQLAKVRNTYKAADAKARKATKKKTPSKTAPKRPQMNAQQRKATQAARDHAKKKR